MIATLNRRKFVGAAGTAAAGALIATSPRAVRAMSSGENMATFAKNRQQTETAIRAVYRAKNDLDLNAFVSKFDANVVYQDATLGISIPGLQKITPLFDGLFKAVAVPGKLSEFTYATGDAQSGAAAEFFDLPKCFANTAYDALSIMMMRGGKIVRNTDYWDSAQLSDSDIFGPESKGGIAFPVIPVHSGGSPTPRRADEFPPEARDGSHAAPELSQFVTQFHGELSSGNFAGAAKRFTDDAVLIHPLLHRGGYGYGPFNETIQIRGADNILRMLKAALPVLPDGMGSQLLQVVGGAAGGGFEWRAGGAYASMGFDRKGIRGATSIDLFRNRIRRLSVKFDTIQMTVPIRDSVRQRLANTPLGQDD